MLIGIDFDNIIAGYDKVFPAAAVAEGLLKEGEALSKRQVHDLLRSRPDGKHDWMRLQGRVYGNHMAQAEMIEGVADFLLRCKAAAIPVHIVSHKTEFGHFDPDMINLRQAALRWMENQGLFDARRFDLCRRDVHFEPTRHEKVGRIAALRCTHFIDDLAEVFLEANFPDFTQGFLFTVGETAIKTGPYTPLPTWAAISDAVFGT